MTRNELLEYFKSERERFEKTRDIQWKFNIALWTLLALAISFLKPENVGECYCLLIIALALFLVCHFVFAYLVQKSLIASRMMACKILDALNEANKPENKEYVDFKERHIDTLIWRTGDFWWVVFEVLSSLVLILVLIMKLTASNG